MISEGWVFSNNFYRFFRSRYHKHWHCCNVVPFLQPHYTFTIFLGHCQIRFLVVSDAISIGLTIYSPPSDRFVGRLVHVGSSEMIIPFQDIQRQLHEFSCSHVRLCFLWVVQPSVVFFSMARMFLGYTDAFSRWLLLGDHTTLYQEAFFLNFLIRFKIILMNSDSTYGIFIKNHPTNHHIFCQKNLPTISQTPMPFGPQISKGTISFGIFCGFSLDPNIWGIKKKGTKNWKFLVGNVSCFVDWMPSWHVNVDSLTIDLWSHP